MGVPRRKRERRQEAHHLSRVATCGYITDQSTFTSISTRAYCEAGVPDPRKIAIDAVEPGGRGGGALWGA